MKSTAELDLKELAKVLTVLFPKQHDRSATWLASLEPVADESEAREARRPVVPDRYPTPRPSPRHLSAPVGTKKPPTTNPSGPLPPRPSKPTPSLPSFANPWAGSASEWGRLQKGIDIPWDEEQRRVDSIIQQSGLTGWQQGFLSELICLTLDLSLASSRTAAVELFIPRCGAFSKILAGVGLPGQPMRLFEINHSNLAPAALRQLAEFGAP